MSFRDKGIEPADGFVGDGFVVRRLVPSDVVLDHAAVMASREFLYHWEQEPPYPPEDFSVEDNLSDLEQMDGAHREGIRYTYTVMNADETEVLGCVYFLPNDDRMYRTAEVTSHDGSDLSSTDATVAFWVRPSTWADGFERALLEALLDWFRNDWSFERPVILTNEHLDHQIATIESLGLTRRFDYDRGLDGVPHTVDELRPRGSCLLHTPQWTHPSRGLSYGRRDMDRQPHCALASGPKRADIGYSLATQGPGVTWCRRRRTSFTLT